MATLSQKGDSTAYRQLLEALYPYIQLLLRKKLNRLVDIEDLTQECLMGVHKNFSSYHPSRPFQPWLSAIVRYKVVDYFRLLSKRNEKELEKMDIPVTNPIDTSNNIDMKEVLSHLPDNLRKVIELTHFEGRSYKEVALSENISEPALRKRISRAYSELKKIISQWDWQ